MKKFFLLVVLSLSAASFAQADQISLAAACGPSSPTLCASPNNLIGGPVSLTVSLGAVTLVFTTSAATQVVQGGITSFDSFFASGGGTVQLFSSSNQLLASGTFLPGATSTSDQGGVFASFDGDVTFSYLNCASLGLSPLDAVGTGHISYSFDETLGPAGDTNFYTLGITGNPPSAVPEPASFFLLFVGLGVALFARFLAQSR